MIYPNYLNRSGTELFIDTLQQTGVANQSNVVEYISHLTGMKKQATVSTSVPRRTLSGTILGTNKFTIERYFEYMLGETVLFCLGPRQMATYAKIVGYSVPTTKASVQPVHIDIVYEGHVVGQFWEAESKNVSGAIGTDTSATMDKSVRFNAVNEMVRATINQDDIILPAGNYRVFARVKDLLQISNDLKLEVYNQTDSVSIASGTQTTASSYAIFTLDFTIDSADVGDVIRFDVSKSTSTANDIDVDFFGLVAVP